MYRIVGFPSSACTTWASQILSNIVRGRDECEVDDGEIMGPLSRQESNAAETLAGQTARPVRRAKKSSRRLILLDDCTLGEVRNEPCAKP